MVKFFLGCVTEIPKKRETDTERERGAISEALCIPSSIHLRGLDLMPFYPRGQAGIPGTSPCRSGAKRQQHLKAVLQDNPSFPHNQGTLPTCPHRGRERVKEAPQPTPSPYPEQRSRWLLDSLSTGT